MPIHFRLSSTNRLASQGSRVYLQNTVIDSKRNLGKSGEHSLPSIPSIVVGTEGRRSITSHQQPSLRRMKIGRASIVILHTHKQTSLHHHTHSICLLIRLESTFLQLQGRAGKQRQEDLKNRQGKAGEKSRPCTWSCTSATAQSFKRPVLCCDTS